MNWVEIERFMVEQWKKTASYEEFIKVVMKKFSWTEKESINNSNFLLKFFEKK